MAANEPESVDPFEPVLVVVTFAAPTIALATGLQSDEPGWVLAAWLAVMGAAVWTVWREPSSRWLGLVACSLLWGSLGSVVAFGGLYVLSRLLWMARY